MFGFEKFARRMGLGSLICLVAALIAMGGSAQAAPREGGLAILGVWVGERPDARLAADVARRLRQLGEQLQAGRSRSKADWSCADVPCLRKTAEELGADRLLQVAIQEVDHDTQRYLINIRLFDNASQQIAERQASCDGCGSSDSRADQIAIITSKLTDATAKPVVRESTAPADDLDQLRPDKNVGPASDQRPRLDRRAMASLVLTGISATSGLAAIGLTVLAAKLQPTTDSSVPGYFGVCNNCQTIWIGSAIATWALAAGSTVAILALRHKKESK